MSESLDQLLDVFNRTAWPEAPYQSHSSMLPRYSAGLEAVLAEIGHVILPSEPGFYLDVDGDIWQLDADECWTIPGNESVDDPRPYVPLRRLIPEEVPA